MRRVFPLVVLAGVLAFGAAAQAGQFGTRTMTGWFNVGTREGWSGRRYMDGDAIVAEEFDSNRDENVDVWRFYRRGVLSSEERDLNHDGKIDLVTRWDGQTGNVVSAMRDTHQRGVNDIEVEYNGRNRWEVREDRNYDGVTDRIIIAQAPPDIFQAQGIDMTSQIDIAAGIPMEYWAEVWSDDGFSGNITDYFRYNRGVLTHHGVWDGRRVVWTRVPPDYVPPRPTPATPPGYREMDQLARRDPERFAPQPPGVATVRDPFNLDPSGLDPYAGIGPRNPEPAPVWGGAIRQQQQEPPPPPPQQARAPAAGGGFGSGAGARYDAGRYRDESSARAVPARMRAPGQSPATDEEERRGGRSSRFTRNRR